MVVGDDKTLAVAKGDFILMDYIAKVKETGEAFDTSLAEDAKQAEIFKENIVYEPMLVVVGEGWVLGSLDEQLAGMEVGKKVTVEIPAEKGFGRRDPSKIKQVPLRKFDNQKIAPAPGMDVEVDGKRAIVRSVGAGRVQVDFNPPLAGRTLIYDVEIKQILQTQEEKTRNLIHRRIPMVDVNKFEIEMTENNITVKTPEEALALEGLHLARRGVALDIQKFFQDIDTVRFIEEYKRKEAKAEPSNEEKPQPSQA
ncbi:MAG: FKBP-type peptidyl-prolyl cis-trans isomerase [Candidatus Bathyarchaeota archaeon]